MFPKVRNFTHGGVNQLNLDFPLLFLHYALVDLTTQLVEHLLLHLHGLHLVLAQVIVGYSI